MKNSIVRSIYMGGKMRKKLMIFLTCLLMCCLSLSVVMAAAETSKEYKDSAGNKFVADIDANGWHKNNPGTEYMDEAGNVVINSAFGSYNSAGSHLVNGNFSTFVLGSGNNVNINRLDLTKKTKIKFKLNPSWPYTGWFIFSVIDGLENAYKAASNTWNLGTAGVKINMWGANFVESDADYANYGHLVNKISVNGVNSNNSMNYNKTGYGELEFFIGETTEESYVNFGGVKVTAPNVKRSDFEEGAYFQVGVYGVLEIEVSVTQESAWDHTVTIVDERKGTSIEVGAGDNEALVIPEDIDVKGFKTKFYLGDEEYDVTAPITSDLTLKVVYEKAPADVYDVRGKIDLPYDDNGITASQNGATYYDENDDDLITANYGMYNTELCTKVMSDGTVFVLDGAKYITYGVPLDLTGLINIRLAMNSEKSWNMDARFVLGLFDSLEQIYHADVNGWNPEFGNKLPIYGSTEKGNDETPASEIYNRVQIGSFISDVLDYISYKDDSAEKAVTLSVYIGETSDESFVAANGVKICGIGVKRSDFVTDYAYLQLLSLGTNQFKIKVTQSTAKANMTFKSNVSGYEEITKSVFVGSKAEAPAAQEIEGYTFLGYYTDSSLTVKFDFDTVIDKDVTIYAAYKQIGATYHTVTIKSKTGKYEYISVEVKDGDTLYGTPTYFDEYGFAFTYVDENGDDFGVDDKVTKDMELTLKWYEEEIVLYHKLHGVVDTEYPYEIDTDDNGWDANYTQWDIGDSFVDKDGNEIIDSYYGSYQHDTSFYTYDDETGFLLCYCGAITNLMKLDVSKEITIKWSARNWDYQNNAATGKIRFALYDGLLKALKGGYSDLSAAKVLLQTETVKTAENFGKMQDMLSDKLSALFADAALEQPFEDDRFYITIYISEDGTENYVKINGEKFSDLEGVKRSDFIGGYAYLSISTSGSTQYIRSLVSQKSDITVVQPEHGTISVDKNEGVGFRDKISVTVTAEKGYKVKSVFVGDVEYELEGADTVVVFKGWGDETITAVVGKEFTVTFVSGGGSTVNPQTVCDGDVVFKPANPKKEGYTFDGWYADEACTELYNFRTPVTKDITLYAKWKEDKKEEPEKTGCNGCSSSVGGGALACFAVTTACAFVALRKKNK